MIKMIIINITIILIPGSYTARLTLTERRK